MAEPQPTDPSIPAKPAATPISTEQISTSRSAASPTEATNTGSSITAEPLPVPGTPPPSVTPPSGNQTPAPREEALNPKLASLQSIFPHFELALLESVLESVNGNEERAADVLLGMSDPEYVSNVTTHHQPTQEELDAELARRLMLEDQNTAAAHQPSWQPQGQNVPYQARYNAPHPQSQGQGQGQGGMDLTEQFTKIAETGRRTITNLFNKVKAKVEEFDSGGRSNQPPPPGNSWAGQNQSYYAPPENVQGHQNSYQPPQNLSPPPSAPRTISDPPITLTDTRTDTRTVSPPPPTGTGTGTTDVDTSRIGLLPRRPVSLVGPKQPQPQSAVEPAAPAAAPAPHAHAQDDDDDLGYVENPFEEDERHR